MCPRATAQHGGGAAMARAAVGGAASVHSFGEEEYIDLDLSSCGELEFRVRRGSADELLCRGGAAEAPRKAAPRSSGAKTLEVDAGCGGGRRSAATVAPLRQHSHSAAEFRDAAQPAAAARVRAEGSRRRKAARTVHAKLQASRAFFRSLFARTSCSDEQCHGGAVRARNRPATTPFGGETKKGSSKMPFGGEIKNGTSKTPFGGGTKTSYGSIGNVNGRTAPTTLRISIEQEKLMDEEELATAAAVRQRKSFSGVIRWRHTTTVPAAAAPAKPLASSSARRGSLGGGGSGGPALKRSTSARSESEGLIQGAIAYCKRSQQQLGLATRSVGDAALCSGPSSWPSNAHCYYY